MKKTNLIIEIKYLMNNMTCFHYVHIEYTYLIEGYKN